MLPQHRAHALLLLLFIAGQLVGVSAGRNPELGPARSGRHYIKRPVQFGPHPSPYILEENPCPANLIHWGTYCSQHGVTKYTGYHHLCRKLLVRKGRGKGYVVPGPDPSLEYYVDVKSQATRIQTACPRRYACIPHGNHADARKQAWRSSEGPFPRIDCVHYDFVEEVKAERGYPHSVRPPYLPRKRPRQRSSPDTAHAHRLADHVFSVTPPDFADDPSYTPVPVVFAAMKRGRYETTHKKSESVSISAAGGGTLEALSQAAVSLSMDILESSTVPVPPPTVGATTSGFPDDVRVDLRLGRDSSPICAHPARHDNDNNEPGTQDALAGGSSSRRNPSTTELGPLGKVPDILNTHHDVGLFSTQRQATALNADGDDGVMAEWTFDLTDLGGDWIWDDAEWTAWLACSPTRGASHSDTGLPPPP